MRHFILILIISFSFFQGNSQTGYYFIDQNHSNIEFNVQFSVFTTITGRFNNFYGIFYYDSQNIENSRIEVSIKTNSIDTRIEARDRDLRNRWFETSVYPNITFNSNDISAKGNRLFEAKGNLTIHGVTKLIKLKFQITGIEDVFNRTEMGFKVLPIKIDRNNYGITRSRSVRARMFVGDTITLKAFSRFRKLDNKSKKLKYLSPEITTELNSAKKIIGEYVSGKQIVQIELDKNQNLEITDMTSNQIEYSKLIKLSDKEFAYMGTDNRSLFFDGNELKYVKGRKEYNLKKESNSKQFNRVAFSLAGMSKLNDSKEFFKNQIGEDKNRENLINLAGYAFIRNSEIKKAINMFEFGISLYPKSSNLFDSLGEAFMLKGNKKEAIVNYKKSLKLNAKNKNAIKMLKKLEK